MLCGNSVRLILETPHNDNADEESGIVDPESGITPHHSRSGITEKNPLLNVCEKPKQGSIFYTRNHEISPAPLPGSMKLPPARCAHYRKIVRKRR